MSSELISTIISSLLPIFVTLFFAWLSNRNDQVKRRNMIEDAKSRIELINEYVSAQNLVIPELSKLEEIKRTAANELYDIKKFLDNNLQSLEKTSKRSDEPIQRFFLIYKMNTFWAALFRILFFITLVFSILLSIFNISVNYSDAVSQLIFDSIVFTTPFILFAFLFRWLAIKLDKPLNPTKQKE
jgi:hypothetical protein